MDFINYFNKGVRVRREHFSKSGYLTHVQYLDPENNILKDELFDFKGQLKILRGYNDGKVSSIEILNNNGSLERVFYSHEELVRWWLKENTISDDIFIVDGGPQRLNLFRDIERSKLNLISVLHSNHILYGDTPDNGRFVSSSREKILSDPGFLKTCVVLTDQQRNDIVKRLAQRCPINTIEHPINSNLERIDFSRRDSRRLIVVSRLVKEKSLSHAIKIMKKVVDKQKDLKLFIYGDGPERENIEKLILDLNLESNIFIEGHTDKVSEKLNESCLFLMTSLYKSLFMAMAESLACGVPVLAYDINYGPAALIKNEYNGYLIPKDNIDLAASLVVQHFESLVSMRNMSENAYSSVEHLYPAAIAKKWVDLIEGLS